MNLLPNDSNTPEKIYRKLLVAGKEVHHLYHFAPGVEKTILFIVGCQRSGTNLMERIFEHDLNTKVYPENSKLTVRDKPKRLRLNSLESVKVVLDKDRAALVVLKPLVESQNTLNLLDYFTGSKALWLYRRYKGVAHSHVEKWGGENSINDLRAIVERQPNNWRCENVSEELRDIVLEHFSDDMADYDAAALYWFVRNNLFFDLRLDRNPRVMICKYEDLAENPALITKTIYQFLGHEFPGNHIVSEVHQNSIKKGEDIQLSPNLEKRCTGLMERLDAEWKKQKNEYLASWGEFANQWLV